MQTTFLAMVFFLNGVQNSASQSQDRILELVKQGSKKLSPAQQEVVARQYSEAVAGKQPAVVERALSEIPAAVRDLESYKSGGPMSDAHLNYLARRSREVLEYNVNGTVAMSAADREQLKTQMQVLKHHLGQVIDSSIQGPKGAEARGMMKEALIYHIDQAATSLFEPNFKVPLSQESFTALTTQLYKVDALQSPVSVSSTEAYEDSIKLMGVKMDILNHTNALWKGSSLFKESPTLVSLRDEWKNETIADLEKGSKAADQRALEMKKRAHEGFEDEVETIRRRLAAKQRAGGGTTPEAEAAQVPGSRPNAAPEESGKRRYMVFALIGALGILLFITLMFRRRSPRAD